jgi:hypothetical protein
MADLVRLLWEFVLDCLRSPEQLRAENTVLRHQLNVLRRKAPKRPRLSNGDKVLFMWLYRLFPAVAGAVTIIRPETVIGWHRAGFRAWWCAGSPVIGAAGLRSILNCGISFTACVMRTRFGALLAFTANC